MKDITERIDELLNFFMNPSHAKTSGDSPAIQSELNMLYNKVIDQIKNITSMTNSNKKKISKKAIEVVIKKEGLNKNWAKLLKKHMKKYS